MSMRFSKKKLSQSFQILTKNTQPFSGTVYRVVSEGLVATNGIDSIISGRGTKEFQGGRWMLKGICYVLYTSFSMSIAAREVIENTRDDNKNFVLARLHVHLDKILDLTDKDNLKTLNAKKEDLILPSYNLENKKESYTQAIGRCAYESGIEGIKVWSAIDLHETNLVVFSSATPVVGVSIIDMEKFKA